MKTIIATGVLLAAAGVASAGEINFSDSYGLATTNWNEDLSLTQFDSSLGTLSSVLLEYDGQVDSNIAVESLDAAPSTVTGTSAADLTFGGPINDVLSISDSQSVDLSAFDGTIDFAGTSGFDFGTITGVDSGSLLLTAPGDLAAFIGAGSVLINVDAAGLSTAEGAGNLVAQIGTEAYAAITVTYTYEEETTVPVPAPLALLGLGLVGMGWMRRRSA